MFSRKMTSGSHRKVVLLAGALCLVAFQVSAVTYGPPSWPLPARGDGPVVGVVTPAPLPDAGSAFTVPTVSTLTRVYDRASFDLDTVRTGESDVPRLYLTAFPADFDAIEQVSQRKDAFFRSVLPLVLRANAEIEIVRTRAGALIDQIRSHEPLRPEDSRWLVSVAQQYGVLDSAASDPRTALSGGAGRTLMRRIDVIPVPLALAQAIVESGWGRSRFAREGNALFGQWTWDKAQGLSPAGAPNASHAVKSFDSLMQSVRGYMHNLNTHGSYRQFRAARAQGASARALARTLTRYSERGAVYGEELVAIMAQNDLEEFADAALGATVIKRGGAWDWLEDVPQS